MKRALTLLLAAALSVGLYTCANAARTLSVTGRGTASSEAGPAEFTVTVETSARTQQDAAADNAGRTRLVRSALLHTGARPDGLTTRNYSIHPIYRYDEKGQTLAGYRATNQIQVRVPYASMTGFFIDAAAENGAVHIDSLRFLGEDAEAVRRRALAAAAADARSKAEALAQTLGCTLGPVLAATASPGPALSPRYDVLMSKTEAMGAPTPAGGSVQTVTAELSVTYELI